MRTGRTQRGAAIITAIVIALITVLMVTAAALLTGATRLNARTKGNSETALLLAEAGANAELRKVTVAIEQYNGSTAWDTPSSKGSGSISSVPGTYSVWTSSNADGTGTWPGSGVFYVTSVATTVGASRRVVVKAQAFSIFDLYAIFAYNAATGGNSSALKLTGNAVVTVTGNVGTNGIVSNGSGTLTINSGSAGYNYNTTAVGGHPQLTTSSGPIYSYTYFKTFPTIPSMAMTSYGGAYTVWALSHPNKDMWDYMAATFPTGEANTIYTWSGNSTTLSTASVTKAFPTANKPPGTTLDNAGLWAKTGVVVNNDPTTAKKAIILQPGDYYFSTCDLTDATKEFIIDNAGITVSGTYNVLSSTVSNGNPNKVPIRIWLARSSSNGNADNISIPIALTNANDRSTIRVFYGTDKQTLKFSASNTSGYNTNGTVFQIAGAFYAISGGSSGTTLDFTGVGQNCNFIGALVADQVNFNGNCNIVWDPGLGNSSDAPGGVGITWGGDYAVP